MGVSSPKKRVKSIYFFDDSNSKEYMATPDVVQCDKKKMTHPMYDLILDCHIMKDLETEVSGNFDGTCFMCTSAN